MSPRYKHECPDWDLMELDENSAELVGCSCYSDPEFLAIREGHSSELDRINEASELRNELAGCKQQLALAPTYEKMTAHHGAQEARIRELEAALRKYTQDPTSPVYRHPALSALVATSDRGA
jgi:hypothetical protein